MCGRGLSSWEGWYRKSTNQITRLSVWYFPSIRPVPYHTGNWTFEFEFQWVGGGEVFQTAENSALQSVWLSIPPTLNTHCICCCWLFCLCLFENMSLHIYLIGPNEQLGFLCTAGPQYETDSSFAWVTRFCYVKIFVQIVHAGNMVPPTLHRHRPNTNTVTNATNIIALATKTSLAVAKVQFQ